MALFQEMASGNKTPSSHFGVVAAGSGLIMFQRLRSPINPASKTEDAIIELEFSSFPDTELSPSHHIHFMQPTTRRTLLLYYRSHHAPEQLCAMPLNNFQSVLGRL